jgi:hypothetical protein
LHGRHDGRQGGDASTVPNDVVSSATLLDSKRPEGLAVCPVTYAELAPVFNEKEKEGSPMSISASFGGGKIK